MNLITRAEAKAQGLKRYFTGRPCKYGHVCERHVASLGCMLCSNEKHREKYRSDPMAGRSTTAEWRKKNPEKKAASYKLQREKNKEKRAQHWVEYYAKNKARLADAARARRQKNPEKIKAGVEKWRQRNPGARVAHEAKRRSAKRNALPPWFGELDEFVWQEAGALVHLREAATGIKWQSDHAIPLLAREACGLHVAANCQVIPAELNSRKGNKMLLTARLEWLGCL